MMPSGEHPLAAILTAAGRGVFPPADGLIDVLPPLPGAADAMIGFTGHFVLAADIPPTEVAERAPAGDFSVPMSSSFLGWIATRCDRRPGTFDALLVADGRALPTTDTMPAWLSPLTDASHPRVARARRYRDDVRVWGTARGDGVLVVGRGVCDRWEVAFEVEPRARNAGLGRRLAAAGRDAVPAGELVWAQIAPANAASLRAVAAVGYRPVGAEVLFVAPG